MFPHRPQEFNGKQRVALGTPQQGRPETCRQPVGFAIQKGIHKQTPFGAFGRTKAQPDIPENQLEFAQDLGQRMTGTVPAKSHLFRTIGADDQKFGACAGKAAAQVKQETNRSGVCPLNIIQDQQQRPLSRQRAEDLRHLLEQVALFHTR